MALFKTIAENFNTWRTDRDSTREAPSPKAGHFTVTGVDLDKIIFESARQSGLS